MTWELRKIGGSGRLCLLLLLAVLCSGVLFALHATGDSGGYTVSALRQAMAQEDLPAMSPAWRTGWTGRQPAAHGRNTTPCAASCPPPTRPWRGCGRRRNIRPFGQAWRQNPRLKLRMGLFDGLCRPLLRAGRAGL